MMPHSGHLLPVYLVVVLALLWAKLYSVYLTLVPIFSLSIVWPHDSHYRDNWMFPVMRQVQWSLLFVDGSVGPSQVSSVVTSTLTKLIRQLSVLYTCEESSIRDRHHYSHSMIDLPVKLARGLHHSLVRVTLEEQLHVAPSQVVVHMFVFFCHLIYNSNRDEL